MRPLLAARLASHQAALIIVAVAIASCASSPQRDAEQYEALRNGRYVSMESCSAKSGDQPDRLLIDHALITSDLALPPDIVFTDIIATSPAGYDFEPVAVVGESPTIYQELLLDQDADAANQMTFVPLPYEPDRSSDFALGVIVEIPADAAANPPAAIEITGATYTTDGKTHTLEFNRQGYVSRIAKDGTWCEQHKDSNDGG